MVTPSSYPLQASVMALYLVSGCLVFLKHGNCLPLISGVGGMSALMFLWFKDVVNEGLMGHHNSFVVDGFKHGMLLFIFSEIMFFFAFFWAFFDSALSPTIEMGMTWGPYGLTPVNPYHIPLLNTTVLLTSGATGTWAHYNLITNTKASNQMVFTLLLGSAFTALQVYEYKVNSFTITDGVYGSVFYVSTGFHGVHVLVGTIFLFVCTIRMVNYQMSCYHHVGLELALWYWHFVDVVWLFLYVFIYWWGF